LKFSAYVKIAAECFENFGGGHAIDQTDTAKFDHSITE